MAPHITNIRLGSLDILTLRGRDVLTMELMQRRRLDICCVQEVRLPDEATELYDDRFGKYKLYCSGEQTEGGCVGVLVSGALIDNVIQVLRVSSRILVLRLSVVCLVMNILSVYVPQVGRSADEKVKFYDDLRLTRLPKVNPEERIIVAGDPNGHFGKEVYGFPEVHGGFGFGTRSMEGVKVLEFCEAMQLTVCNTRFNKPKSKLFTYCSGEHETVTDYILERRRHRMVKDVKVVLARIMLLSTG